MRASGRGARPRVPISLPKRWLRGIEAEASKTLFDTEGTVTVSTDHTNGSSLDASPDTAGSADFSIPVFATGKDEPSRVAAVDDISDSASAERTTATQFATTSTDHDAIEFRVIRPGAPVRRLRLTGNRYTFGSAEGCSIRLADHALRPMHAVLIRDASRILVRAYSVPIQINGTRTTEATLQVGDVLRLGSYQFELLSTSGKPSTAPLNPRFSTAPRSVIDPPPRFTNPGPSDSPSPSAGEASPNAPTSSAAASRFGKSRSGRELPSPEDVIWRERLRREIDQWRDRQTECDRRENRCDEREADLRSRESELWSRAENLYRRESRLQSQEAAAFQLYDEYTQRQEELIRLREETQTRQHAFQQREAEFLNQEFEYRQRLEDATRQLEQSKQQAETATEAVSRMRQQFESLNQQIEELSDQQKEIETREQRQRDEHERLRLDLETARDQAIDAQAESEARRAEAEHRVEEMAAQIESLKSGQGSDLQEQQARLAESEQVAEQLRAQVSDLQESVAKASEESAQLRRDYEEACESVRQLESLVAQHNEQDNQNRESWAAEADELRAAVDQVSVELARANNELGELREANGALSARLDEMTSERDEARQDAESRPTNDAFDSLRGELEAANDQLAGMKRDYEETLAKLEESRREAEEAQRREEARQEARALSPETATAGGAAIEASSPETEHDAPSLESAGDHGVVEAEQEFESQPESNADNFDSQPIESAAEPAAAADVEPVEAWGDQHHDAAGGDDDDSRDEQAAAEIDTSHQDDAVSENEVDVWASSATDSETSNLTEGESSKVSNRESESGGWGDSADSPEQSEVSGEDDSDPWGSQAEANDEQSSVWSEAPEAVAPESHADEEAAEAIEHTAAWNEANFDSNNTPVDTSEAVDSSEAVDNSEANESAWNGDSSSAWSAESSQPDSELSSSPWGQTDAEEADEAHDGESVWQDEPSSDRQWDASESDDASLDQPIASDESAASESPAWTDDSPSPWASDGSEAADDPNDSSAEIESSTTAEPASPEMTSVWDDAGSELESGRDSWSASDNEAAAGETLDGDEAGAEDNSDSEDSLVNGSLASMLIKDIESEENTGPAEHDGTYLMDGEQIASSWDRVADDPAKSDPQGTEYGEQSWDREYAEEGRSSDWSNNPEGYRVEEVNGESHLDQLQDDAAGDIESEYGHDSHAPYEESFSDDESADHSRAEAFADEPSSTQQFDPDSMGADPSEIDLAPAEVAEADRVDAEVAEADRVDAEIDEADPQATDSEPAAAPPSGFSDAAGDDSIEAYMNRLLQRVQGEPGAVSDEPETVSVSTSQSSSLLQEPENEASIEATVEAEEEPIDPEAPLIPRSQAPEKTSDLSAMRELANASARSAISRSVRIQTRDTQIRGMISFGCAAGALICGAMLYIFVPDVVPMVARFLMVAMTIVVAVIYVKEGLNDFAEANARLRAAESGLADPEAEADADAHSGESTEPSGEPEEVLQQDV